MEEAGDEEVNGTDARKKLKQDNVTVTSGVGTLEMVVRKLLSEYV